MPLTSSETPLKPEPKLRVENKISPTLKYGRRKVGTKRAKKLKKEKPKINGKVIQIGEEKYYVKVYKPLSMFSKTKRTVSKRGTIFIYGYYAKTKKWFLQAKFTPIRDKKKQKDK